MEKNIVDLLKKGKHQGMFPSGAYIYYDFNLDCEHMFFCNECLENRRMKVKNINKKIERAYGENLEKAIQENIPLIFYLECLQCKSKAYLIIYENDGQQKSVILYEKAGGCTSKNAPDGVKYYLNEAYQSKIIGAQSASMSMYRAALDFLLYEQGFTQGMLGKKISDLEAAIADNSAPKWAKEIDTEFLRAIKKIGNSSIHPNDGDILKQKEIDEKLLNIVDIVFVELLDKIYEQPIRTKNRLGLLEEKVSILNKKENSEE